MSTLTQNKLKELLNYNPNTGVFTWLVARGGNFTGVTAGSTTARGYITIRVNTQAYQAHRLAYLYMTGEFPLNDIDHINHVPDDNRWENLRAVTHKENLMNQLIRINNTSGCMGVHWNKKNTNWLVRIMNKGKYISIGSFNNLGDAVAARKAAEIEYGYHANHGSA